MESRWQGNIAFTFNEEITIISWAATLSVTNLYALCCLPCISAIRRSSPCRLTTSLGFHRLVTYNFDDLDGFITGTVGIGYCDYLGTWQK